MAYALGYTGLGVGATRFGAEVMLDLLDGADDRADPAGMVREQPLPFPPEPFALRRHPAHPLVAGPRRRAATAAATSGCAPWTGSASASTPDVRQLSRGHRQPDPGQGRRRTDFRPVDRGPHDRLCTTSGYLGAALLAIGLNSFVER